MVESIVLTELDKDFKYDITDIHDPMPLLVLWIYILTNVYKLALTSFDPTQLLMYHNMYVENGTFKPVDQASRPRIEKTVP